MSKVTVLYGTNVILTKTKYDALKVLEEEVARLKEENKELKEEIESMHEDAAGASI